MKKNEQLKLYLIKTNVLPDLYVVAKDLNLAQQKMFELIKRSDMSNFSIAIHSIAIIAEQITCYFGNKPFFKDLRSTQYVKQLILPDSVNVINDDKK